MPTRQRTGPPNYSDVLKSGERTLIQPILDCNGCRWKPVKVKPREHLGLCPRVI